MQDEEVPLLLVDKHHRHGNGAALDSVTLRKGGADDDAGIVTDEVVLVVTDHHRELRCRGLASARSSPVSRFDTEVVADVVDHCVVETEPDDGRVNILLGVCVNTNHPFEMW